VGSITKNTVKLLEFMTTQGICRKRGIDRALEAICDSSAKPANLTVPEGVNLGAPVLPTRELPMRLLSKRQVRDLVLYSPQHTARMEKDGTFPKRVRLGSGRVGYVESEILNWIAARIAERDKTH